MPNLMVRMNDEQHAKLERYRARIGLRSLNGAMLDLIDGSNAVVISDGSGTVTYTPRQRNQAAAVALGEGRVQEANRLLAENARAMDAARKPIGFDAITNEPIYRDKPTGQKTGKK